MEFRPTAIPDVIVIQPRVFGDRRGFFLETWRADLFAANGLPGPFVQDNHSHSAANIMRGLHYQVVQPQGKLVRVSRGIVVDVAVDLRRNSPYFGRWIMETLHAENGTMLWVPPGFAHGFYVLEGPADFQYRCTDYYAPAHERCIRWDDPDLAIPWPVPAGQVPLVSAKDAAGLPFRAAPYYD